MFHVCENEMLHVYETKILCSCKYNIILLYKDLFL